MAKKGSVRGVLVIPRGKAGCPLSIEVVIPRPTKPGCNLTAEFVIPRGKKDCSLTRKKD